MKNSSSTKVSAHREVLSRLKDYAKSECAKTQNNAPKSEYDWEIKGIQLFKDRLIPKYSSWILDVLPISVKRTSNEISDVLANMLPKTPVQTINEFVDRLNERELVYGCAWNGNEKFMLFSEVTSDKESKAYRISMSMYKDIFCDHY